MREEYATYLPEREPYMSNIAEELNSLYDEITNNDETPMVQPLEND